MSIYHQINNYNNNNNSIILNTTFLCKLNFIQRNRVVIY